MMKSGTALDMYVMMYGRVKPVQRNIIRRRCMIDVDKYKSVLNWLIDNHPSYSDMESPENCPQPIFIGGFDSNANNTDASDGT